MDGVSIKMPSLGGLADNMPAAFSQPPSLSNFKSQLGFGGAAEPPQGLMDEVGESMSLTWKQRLQMFAGFMVMSWCCYGLAIFFAPMIAVMPKKFAFFFTAANFFGIASTAFLVGPWKQLRSMGEHNRQLVSLVYLTSMTMTLTAAVHWRNSALVIFFCAVQVASLVWYSLSYIPYARHVAAYALGPAAKVCWSTAQVGATACFKCCKVVMSR
eukprot:TRINITY_DN791_c0_g7_i1.p2 TRINITY_DN791_c0_g7~~TRINITY_DN791_c0_g7_i1.p2  ORF type:complete len:213 (+),score=47.36 TRINITY_DN791_c0_g7_i1:80-718(+)